MIESIVMNRKISLRIDASEHLAISFQKIGWIEIQKIILVPRHGDCEISLENLEFPGFEISHLFQHRLVSFFIQVHT